MAFAAGRRIGPVVSTIGRLTRRSDFLAAAGGRRFHTERMTAQGRLREAAGPALRSGEDGLNLGFTITKRVGHATERNRIRRRLRGAVKRAADGLPVLAADVVLIARRPALHAPFETLVADLRRAVDAVTKPRAQGASESRSASTKRRSGKPAAAQAGGSPPPATPAASAKPAPTTSRAEAENRRPPSPPTNACDGSLDG